MLSFWPSVRAMGAAPGRADEPKVEESKPVHEVKVEFDRRIPMRDGVTLSADVYRPDSSGRFPVILSRTPYLKTPRDKESLDRQPLLCRQGLCRRGCRRRGRGDSAAHSSYRDEGRDGHDAIEWCGVQPWSTGKVGTLGGLLHCEEPVAGRGGAAAPPGRDGLDGLLRATRSSSGPRACRFRWTSPGIISRRATCSRAWTRSPGTRSIAICPS